MRPEDANLPQCPEQAKLGEFESGVTAALFGTVPAAVLGGLGTIGIALLWMRLFPELRRVERLE